MLRFCLIWITGTASLLTLWVALAGHMPQAWPVLIWLVLIFAGLLFERFRYKNDVALPPGPDWLATDERSVEPEGNVRVWCHPVTGERAYVREPPC